MEIINSCWPRRCKVDPRSGKAILQWGALWYLRSSHRFKIGDRRKERACIEIWSRRRYQLDRSIFVRPRMMRSFILKLRMLSKRARISSKNALLSKSAIPIHQTVLPHFWLEISNKALVSRLRGMMWTWSRDRLVQKPSRLHPRSRCLR